MTMPLPTPYPLTPNPCLPLHRRGRQAFTLIELLIAMAIIAILVGFISSAIVKSIDSATRKRRAATCNSLADAILNYWHDYSNWPITGFTSDASYPSYVDGSQYEYTVWSNENYRIFGNLKVDSSVNPGNPFKRAYFAFDPDSAFVTENKALCDDRGIDYTVIINFRFNTVTVKAE